MRQPSGLHSQSGLWLAAFGSNQDTWFYHEQVRRYVQENWQDSGAWYSFDPEWWDACRQMEEEATSKPVEPWRKKWIFDKPTRAGSI